MSSSEEAPVPVCYLCRHELDEIDELKSCYDQLCVECAHKCAWCKGVVNPEKRDQPSIRIPFLTNLPGRYVPLCAACDSQNGVVRAVISVTLMTEEERARFAPGHRNKYEHLQRTCQCCKEMLPKPYDRQLDIKESRVEGVPKTQRPYAWLCPSCAKYCQFCQIPMEGMEGYALHRDGFSDGPELPLCRQCHDDDSITCEDVWMNGAKRGIWKERGEALRAEAASRKLEN